MLIKLPVYLSFTIDESVKVNCQEGLREVYCGISPLKKRPFLCYMLLKRIVNSQVRNSLPSSA
jgi:hypothetical protein